jgi:hypothetical protein
MMQYRRKEATEMKLTFTSKKKDWERNTDAIGMTWEITGISDDTLSKEKIENLENPKTWK